jgi:N-acetylglucosaminyldiphosphoundecaprenol N-acetyl-beta-D-mannosaminyltransferase
MQEIVPEIMPEMMKEIMPEMMPEIMKEIMPEIMPQIMTDNTPGNTRESMRRLRNMNSPRSLQILSVRVSCVTMSETLSALESMVESREPHHVVTVNPEFIMASRGNSAFRHVLNSADLAVPDGTGVVLASGILGRPIGERVPGVDLIEQFAVRGGKKRFRFFLLGASPGLADRAAFVLQGLSSGLEIAGTFSGSPDPESEDEICRRIIDAKPDVLLVAFGSPAQDLWIARTKDRLRVPVSIGVGGSLDYIAGSVARAPAWMRGLGLEWLYRLMNQPGRWRRMLVLPGFVILVLKQSLERDGRDLAAAGNTGEAQLKQAV